METINIAFFGSQGAGKTTLLSSYYGNLQSSKFSEKHGYKLRLKSIAQSNHLLKNFYGLKEGQFPLGTVSDEIYNYEIIIEGSKNPTLGVNWLDYPGGWWEREPKDKEEYERRNQTLQELIKNHVAFLIVDGEKVKSQGGKYIRHLLDHLKNEISRQHEIFNNNGIELSNYPDSWVIALTKSDLFGDNYSAEDFHKLCIQEAEHQLTGLAKEINSNSFGRQYLLLSSVSTNNNHIDVSKNRGLNLIAPLAFLQVLNKIKDNIDKRKDELNNSWWKVLEGVFMFLDKLDDFLPPKYQIISILLKPINKLFNGTLDEIKKDIEKLKQQGKFLEATTLTLLTELKSEKAKKDFFKID